VAIPAFMDYMKRSKKIEAVLMLNKIGKNNKREYMEHSTYVTGPGSQPRPLPARRPVAAAAAWAKNGNNPTTTTCAPRPQRRGIRGPGLAGRSGFSIEEDSLFYYDYTGSTTKLSGDGPPADLELATASRPPTC